MAGAAGIRARSPALAAALALAGCAQPAYESNWDRLRPGMDRSEVEALLGTPSSTYLPPAPAPGPAGTPAAPVVGERWQYGDTLSSLATRAVFPDQADERAWCVFFAPDGTVSGFRPAQWATGRAVHDPPMPGVRGAGDVDR
jgi:hypothetical protein